MTHRSHRSEQVVDRLTDVPAELRRTILDGPRDPQTHRRWFDGLPVLREIEAGGYVPRRDGCGGPLRVLAWNVERLRHLDPIAAILQQQRADVSLLCEVDRGMARTGNADRATEIATRLGEGFVYAVEYVELGLGDLIEQARHAGEANERGFHGAMIASSLQMRRPFLVRLEEHGGWFDGTRNEPRVGGTIALGCQVEVDGIAVTLVNVHLESHGSPQGRAVDTIRLLDALDDYDPRAPVLLGGDFNTSTASHAARHGDPAGWRRTLADEPDRLTRPERHEPLFAVLAERGFDASCCNVDAVPTTRHADPQRPRAKIDWFFTRGLVATEPAIVPAVDGAAAPISDHDALVVTVRPQTRP